MHRIGRTGRCGKTGIATTFINKTCGMSFVVNQNIEVEYLYFADESVLLDLKHLLIEAKQKIPPVLATLESQNDYLEIGGMLIVT